MVQMKTRKNHLKTLLMLIAVMAVITGCQSGKSDVKESGTTFAKDALTPFVQSGQLPGAINVFYKTAFRKPPVSVMPMSRPDVQSRWMMFSCSARRPRGSAALQSPS